MDTEERLIAETETWTARIKKELQGTEPQGIKGSEFMRNIEAYVSDSSHFRKDGDLVRSFEAIVWAWAWLEIGKDMGFLKKEYVDIGRD
jgi:hypothetical protein